MPEHKRNVLRPITPEMEAGLVPAGWSWEQDGGMCNCFPYDPGWDRRSDDGNRYWTEKGFTAPRPLYFQTDLQRAAPDLLKALEHIIASADAGNAAILSRVLEPARAAVKKATGQA